jgi:hypothetical protein
VADGLDDLPNLISEQEYRAAAEDFLARTSD